MIVVVPNLALIILVAIPKHASLRLALSAMTQTRIVVVDVNTHLQIPSAAPVPVNAIPKSPVLETRASVQMTSKLQMARAAETTEKI